MGTLNGLHTDPLILDGGFGTTLEQLFRINISNTPLWSAQAILDHPDTVIEAHLAFLRAGAEVISTSTYQCSYATFARAGYTDTDAKRIMSQSVYLANKTREIFREEQTRQGDPIRAVRIALSLGPFGASLSPAHEFDGIYPPPFGPRASSDDPEDAGGQNCNTFGHDEVAENESIQALMKFHLDRLLIFLEDQVAWSGIDYIAFETVPLTREIKAIRRAMGHLGEEMRARQGFSEKPWWISMVFPDGLYPETNQDGISRLRVADVVSAAVGNPTPAYPCPSGLGINCTQVEYLPQLVRQLENGLRNLGESEDFRGHTSTSSDQRTTIVKPFLVLYPNGGDVYDPINQVWVEGQKDGEENWARALQRCFEPSDVWSGCILGGCCRTTPRHISSLLSQIMLHRRNGNGLEQAHA
ncbi:Homocysteine S-methyltransferase [Lentinula raphanica]|nr:Homocysteine S-methyltransferase [Lentinula raphanica]